MRSRPEAEVLAASFRDPNGFLFRRDGTLYRQVNRSYAEHYDALMASGLYAELVEHGLLLPHQESQVPPALPAQAFKVLHPEPLDFVSYPYEWCFGQLREAALSTLRVQRRALKHGMTLKDASAYNVQFHGGRAVLVDTLSFEVLREGEPWVAYRQFCQHFLGPLALMAHCDVRLGQWSRIGLDGVPLDLASRLLPRNTWLWLPLLLHIHVHARAQRRYGAAAVAPHRERRRMGLQALQGLADGLQGAVRRLDWKERETPWSDYAEAHSYSQAAHAAKRGLVAGWLERVQPGSTWDLGANVGEFSRISSGRGTSTIAFDSDHGAVERNYQRCKAEGDSHLLPLVLDLTNPSPAIGWSNQERLSLRERGPAGMVMALALIHHLAISNNVPLPLLAAFFASLAPWLIIEFVPKSDSQVQRLLENREDIFPDYTVEGFEAAFRDRFRIVESSPLPESQRRLYLMESLR